MIVTARRQSPVNVVPPSSLKNLHPQKRFVSSDCSILSSCSRPGCSHSYVDSHHLCTDAAALCTAVSEVAFLVQNRHSPYITFCRLLSVSRFVTEDTLQNQKYISIFYSASPSTPCHEPPLVARVPTGISLPLQLATRRAGFQCHWLDSHHLEDLARIAPFISLIGDCQRWPPFTVVMNGNLDATYRI